MSEAKKIKSRIIVKNGLRRNLPKSASKGELLVTLDEDCSELYIGTGESLTRISRRLDSYLDLNSECIGLSDQRSLTSIATKIFKNKIINFENKKLTLDSNISLEFHNCVIMNLNVDYKNYASMNIKGNNFKIEFCQFNGEFTNKDYFNQNDVDKPLFIPINISGSNWRFNNNTIENFTSRQAILIKNSKNFEITHCQIQNCWSYNRINHSNNGGFDNYGDGIYITNSKGGVVGHNDIINSESNPIGRCGICSEFQTENILIDSNNVCGYDRGVHVELCTDNITVSNNNVKSCNVTIMLWNCKSSKIEVVNNILTTKGLDPSNPLHNSILTYGISVISILGDYDENQKNNSNIVIENNKLNCFSDCKYKTYSIFIENAPPVRIINNKILSDDNSAFKIYIVGDNSSRKFSCILENNETNVDFPCYYFDTVRVVNNSFNVFTYYGKTGNNNNNNNPHDKIIENNIIMGTWMNGGVAFALNSCVIFRNNTVYNPRCQYLFHYADNSIIDGNIFICDRIQVEWLDFRLVKNSGRFKIGSSTKVYGLMNNLFLNNINAEKFEVRAENAQII